jgi:hypothetical protein
VATITQPAPVTVRCPACGDARSVGPRQGRRYPDGVALCRPCSRGRVVERSTEPIMRRWLEAFDDESILAMARHVWNRRGGSIAAAQAHRQRLNVPEP